MVDFACKTCYDIGIISMEFEMKRLIVILAVLLSGCQQVADVTRLPEPYRQWFIEAASIEGFDTTIDGNNWDIEVRLDWGLPYPNRASTDFARSRSRIRLNPANMSLCYPGGIELRFKNVSRHELRHTRFVGHSSDSDRLMYESSPCYPVD